MRAQCQHGLVIGGPRAHILLLAKNLPSYMDIGKGWSGHVALILYTVYPRKYAHGFCFVVVIHWLIFPYPSGLLHWHCGNLTIAPVPAKQPWWIWINTSCEFIMNDCITTTKQSTTKPCAYFLGHTVPHISPLHIWYYVRIGLRDVIWYRSESTTEWIVQRRFRASLEMINLQLKYPVVILRKIIVESI